MKPKRLIFIGFLVVSVMLTSCEKDKDLNELIGKWTFYEACNLNLEIGCIKAKYRDFIETIEFTNNKFTIYYNDSLVTSITYTVSNDWLVFGDSFKIGHKYSLRNDTLTIIDTCFACYRTDYLRTRN